MEYSLVYATREHPWPLHPPRSVRKTSYDINELINLALDETDQYDYCYIRLPSQPTGITVWTPQLGYIGKETR